jgi:hypothetical protein
MVRFQEGWDPEAAGSRFTSRAALVLLTRKDGASRMAVDSDTGNASAVIEDAMGSDALVPDPALGSPTPTDGSDGRGGEVWAPVIEWTVEAMIGGVVGNVAWAGVTAAASRLRERIARLRQDRVRFNVSRGAAAFLAIGHVLEQSGEADVLDVEAVEEPSTMAGASPHELNYVGADPWLVLLLNSRRTYRYVVAVTPDGHVVGALKMPMGEIERAYLRLGSGHNS